MIKKYLMMRNYNSAYDDPGFAEFTLLPLDFTVVRELTHKASVVKSAFMYTKEPYIPNEVVYWNIPYELMLASWRRDGTAWDKLCDRLGDYGSAELIHINDERFLNSMEPSSMSAAKIPVETVAYVRTCISTKGYVGFSSDVKHCEITFTTENIHINDIRRMADMQAIEALAA